MPNIHSSISFGLVNIPVRINPLIKNNDISFNQLHDKCLHRIKYLKYCPYCQKNIKESNILKGYEYEKDNYLVFTKEEINKLKPEKDGLITVIAFIDLKEIDPIYYEKSYILEKDNKSKAYNLFYEALKKTKKGALAKTVLASKFYYCILRYTPFGIILTTLYFAEEIKMPENDLNVKSEAKELELALKLIENMSSKFNINKYKDEYQNNIKEAVKTKLKGQKIKDKKKNNAGQINDLMKALEKSLGAQK